MRSITSILIGWTLFYIALNVKDKYGTFKGILLCSSFVMTIISIALMVFGV